MISLYKIKPAFQHMLMPVLKGLHKLGVTANQITIASILLSLAIGVSFWFADKYVVLFLALPIGLLLRMALNALDGMMARKYNQLSKKGEVLNELGDIISDLFIFFPLLKFESNNLYLVVTFICLSVINEFAGILAKVVSGERRYDGPMGKSDRALMIGVYGIIAFAEINIQSHSIWIFVALILLVLISTSIRISKSLKS